MSKEVKDGHPCETCLRWPECNGVDWPDCQPLLSIADIDQIEKTTSGLLEEE